MTWNHPPGPNTDGVTGKDEGVGYYSFKLTLP